MRKRKWLTTFNCTTEGLYSRSQVNKPSIASWALRVECISSIYPGGVIVLYREREI